MLNIETITRQLAPLIVLYPEAGHNGETLNFLAELWQDLLADEDVSEPEFLWAMRRAMKKCRFFPKIADIMEGVDKYREEPPTKVTYPAHMLPQQSAVALSPEEIARNKAKLEVIKLQLARQITTEEAEQRIMELDMAA